MRAAVYARISEDRGGEAAGVARQVDDATVLAHQRGWTVAETFVDNDVSASRYTRQRRPAYTAMLAAVEHGAVEVVVAYHTDRLYRRPRELEDLIDLADNILIATCEGDFDLATSDGRAMARVIAAIAAKSSDDSSRRLKRKHVELAAAGKIGGGGRRPFGFEPDRLTLRAGEAALIRDAAGRVLAGDTLRSILQDWRRAGVATVTGAPWQTSTLKRLLCSARISGQREHRGQLVGPAVWPAIIDPGTTIRLRALLRDPNRNRANGVAARSYLLAGLVICGRCDVAMTTRPTARGRHRYYCASERGGCNRCGISADRLEADITDAVCALIDGGDLARRVEARRRGDPETVIVDAIATAEAELHLLAGDYAAGAVGREAFAAATRALDTRLVSLRSQLGAARTAGQVFALPPATWDALSFDRRRAVVCAVIDRIVVAPTTKANNCYDPTRWQNSVIWKV